MIHEGFKRKLTATSSLMRRQKDAEAAANKILHVYLTFSLKRYAGTLPYKEQTEIEIEISALRKAGLPH